MTKVFATDKPAVRIVLDPHLETADCDLSNNLASMPAIKV